LVEWKCHLTTARTYSRWQLSRYQRDDLKRACVDLHPRIRVGYPALGLGQPDPSLFVAGQILDCKPGTLARDVSLPSLTRERRSIE
jgi:hypothetical protein